MPIAYGTGTHQEIWDRLRHRIVDAQRIIFELQMTKDEDVYFEIHFITDVRRDRYFNFVTPKNLRTLIIH